MCPELAIIVNIRWHHAGEFLGHDGSDIAANTEVSLGLSGPVHIIAQSWRPAPPYSFSYLLLDSIPPETLTSPTGFTPADLGYAQFCPTSRFCKRRTKRAAQQLSCTGEEEECSFILALSSSVTERKYQLYIANANEVHIKNTVNRHVETCFEIYKNPEVPIILKLRSTRRFA
ncbi:hypothetical protein E5288_WYG019889 [Bos mutus]|uniref:Uncharacterized protein n=1 Tax=Bos mutus TaxID=72004 RepID=A0A6B0RRJ1_9CETA|nr:hypothetical protein [Bos mutus]